MSIKKIRLFCLDIVASLRGVSLLSHWVKLLSQISPLTTSRWVSSRGKKTLVLISSESMLLSVSFEIDEVRSETLFRKPSSYLHRLQCPSWHIKFLICFYRTFFNTGNPFDFSEKQPLVNVICQSCSGKWKFNMETSSTWLRWDSITSVFLWILWLQTLYCF